MTVYEIINIEHCTVEEIGNPVVCYRIISDDGWYIHLNDGDEATENYYKGAVALRTDYDFTQVEIVSADELPDNAEIHGNRTPKDEEVTE